ncbi:MAG: MutS family DNA mismatch repair protein [Nitrospirae bacterium]|nr:MutS family DNA mismatch repair protein [Nitrospirota bacterium]
MPSSLLTEPGPSSKVEATMQDNQRPPETSSREQTLQRLLSRTARLLVKGHRASATLTRWRLILFVTALLCTITLYRLGWYQAGNLSLGSFLAFFLLVASYHTRLEQRIHRIRLWQHIKQTHLARLRLDWDRLPERAYPTPDSHLYAKDLDLVGPHSLFQLLDTTVSSHGRERLASWLLTQPPAPDEWAERQTLIRELAARSLFRDRFTLEARLLGEQEIDGHRLTAVLQHRLEIPRLHIILPLQAILAATTLGLGLAALLNWLPSYWMFSFGLYALLYFFTDQGEELLEQAVGLHHEVEKLGKVLGYIDRHARRSPSALARTWAPLASSDQAPVRLIRQAARILHAVSIKAHPLVHLVANALCPWDLWYVRKLGQIQDQIRDHLPLWLDRLAEVEAAAALGTFAHLHPTYIWPSSLQANNQESGATALCSARNLAHPLIPAASRVANDFSLRGLGQILLVTGSNMSGKSTFLRTIGMNLCLAQAGAPVCASQFEWTWLRIACCIRVDDSLDAGLSFFYAEVKRLKSLLDATTDRSQPPVLFLIDEIFKGTNNRERLIGSRSFITALAKSHGFGLVTTHDLELTELEHSVPSVTNAHFQETVAAGELLFDYQLRPGPCPTTNALRIMQLEGLPVPGTSPDHTV